MTMDEARLAILEQQIMEQERRLREMSKALTSQQNLVKELRAELEMLRQTLAEGTPPGSTR